MEGRHAGDGRRILDEAVARPRAHGTAWCVTALARNTTRRTRATCAVERAGDLRGRICVAGEVDLAPPTLIPADEDEPTRRDGYAGGSRFVGREEGWEKTDNDIEGPRLAAVPVWPRESLRYTIPEIVRDGVTGLLVAPEDPGTEDDQ
jgi:hypothetical protein